MEVANPLAYYDTATITAVKKFYSQPNKFKHTASKQTDGGVEKS
jgi:hypothetical protein